MGAKTGILLLNLGGPDSLQAVKPFLYNLFSDPDIIRLPFSKLLQKPLAWIISTARERMACDAYGQMGGRSPILPLTEDQAKALQVQLKDNGLDYPVYIGMRYWHPFIEEAVDLMIQDGIEDLIILPLFPQYSLTTTGSSMNELERCFQQKNAQIPYKLIESYHNYPDYLAALGATISEAIAENPWGCSTESISIVFSAHSLPKKFAEETGDVYPQQIQETASLLMAAHFPNNPWRLCFQSKIGKIPWLQPYTEDMIDTLSEEGVDNILLVPISFVSEHIETLYEIDLLYIPQAKALQMQYVSRSKALNSHPHYIKALTKLVLEQVKSEAPALV